MKHHLTTTLYLLLLAALFLAACNSSNTGVVTPTPSTSTIAATPVAPTPVAATPVAPTPTLLPTSAATNSVPPATATVTTAIPPTLPPITVPPLDTSYQELGSPTSLLASYYNAINLGQYDRAYNYLGESPTITYDQFVQNLTGATTITPVIIPPTFLEGAAGSIYAQVPTFLLISYPDGSQMTSQGCTVTRTSNLGPDGGPPTGQWHIYSEDFVLTTSPQIDLSQLAQACPLPLIDNSRPAYDFRDTPPDVLASLFDAVNRQDYGRAYNYWENLTTTPEQFAQGYADTSQVIVALIPPSSIGAAAGSMYAQIPTFLLATHNDGTIHPFQGCYVTRRTNPGVTDPPQETFWGIYSANILPAPGPTIDVPTLAGLCPSA